MFEITTSSIFMLAGFIISLFACISNDIIQTLGTFLSATKDKPVWQVWLFASFIIVLTFITGWCINYGDMTFGRLDRIPYPNEFHFWYILSPVLLIVLTKFGIPVATSFLTVSIFSSNTVIALMIAKSFIGYALALIVSFIIYFFSARKVERAFLYTKNKPVSYIWIILKWISTAFLLSAWLLQDGAVLYVFLPRRLNFVEMIVSLILLISVLYYICSKRGGNLTSIIKLKTNTQDIRSCVIIDLIFASILIYFMFLNNIPMSTTWVFLGVLGGRELALYNRLRYIPQKKVYKHVLKDLTKAIVGLIISVTVVFLLCHQKEIFAIFHQLFFKIN